MLPAKFALVVLLLWNVIPVMMADGPPRVGVTPERAPQVEARTAVPRAWRDRPARESLTDPMERAAASPPGRRPDASTTLANAADRSDSDGPPTRVAPLNVAVSDDPGADRPRRALEAVASSRSPSAVSAEPAAPADGARRQNAPLPVAVLDWLPSRAVIAPDPAPNFAPSQRVVTGAEPAHTVPAERAAGPGAHAASDRKIPDLATGLSAADKAIAAADGKGDASPVRNPARPGPAFGDGA
ncbi:hypothetical protein L1787_06200 [Acuticoccus sp. M5D2P5]|uniref:hypothetical protein n=1 Tax=Acuticoccus kalidii TaxID=2910977 RepID=UPI001F26ADA8|nr:hypothetical protein [Acuticoccus kalidii]MCF3933005.1 hypothetical protein [Acuticoccus kalidii]